MALDVQTLIDGMLDDLYDTSFETPTAVAEAWAGILEDYVVDLIPAILTDTTSVNARTGAVTTALTPVFAAPVVDIPTLAAAMSTALGTWTVAVGATFITPTVIGIPPLALTLLVPLQAVFVLNSTLSPFNLPPVSVADLQETAVTNIAEAIDAWMLTGTAITAPGPPPVVTNWS